MAIIAKCKASAGSIYPADALFVLHIGCFVNFAAHLWHKWAIEGIYSPVLALLSVAFLSVSAVFLDFACL